MRLSFLQPFCLFASILLIIGIDLQTNDIFKTELSEGQHRLSPEEIHKVQQVVYGITIDITELCSELNIPYMLTGGTALGAVRHGGFIPWLQNYHTKRDEEGQEIERFPALF